MHQEKQYKTNTIESPTLFELDIQCSLISFKSYENLLNDMIKLFSLVSVYYILGFNGGSSAYLFDAPNVILLSMGILVYHLIVSRIVNVKMIKKMPSDNDT
jgi:hypothetical protein